MAVITGHVIETQDTEGDRVKGELLYTADAYEGSRTFRRVFNLPVGSDINAYAVGEYTQLENAILDEAVDDAWTRVMGPDEVSEDEAESVINESGQGKPSRITKFRKWLRLVFENRENPELILHLPRLKKIFLDFYNLPATQQLTQRERQIQYAKLGEGAVAEARLDKILAFIEVAYIAPDPSVPFSDALVTVMQKLGTDIS